MTARIGRYTPAVDVLMIRTVSTSAGLVAAQLSEAAGMSRSSFAERFAASTGRTPMDFVRETRIRAAGRLLTTTDLSVDGVADRVGFASRSHFSRAFRDYFQKTPSEFRAG